MRKLNTKIVILFFVTFIVNNLMFGYDRDVDRIVCHSEAADEKLTELLIFIGVIDVRIKLV